MLFGPEVGLPGSYRGGFCFVLGLGGSDRAETQGIRRSILELRFAAFSALGESLGVRTGSKYVF